MKLAHSLAMLASASSGVLAQHKDCTEAVIASITVMHEYEHCNRDTGFTFSANESTALTTELLAQICATHDCVHLVADIIAMGISECEVNGVYLLMDIVEPIGEACGSGSTSGSATVGSVEVEASDDDADASADLTASGAGSTTAGSVEMEASDDDDDASAEATTNSNASSNSTAATPAPSSTASGASTASLAVSALLLTGAAIFAL